MARNHIEVTFTLDPETVRRLEALARRLGVSASEAVRRAIGAAAEGSHADGRESALAALRELRRSLDLDASAAGDWIHLVRGERRRSSRS